MNFTTYLRPAAGLLVGMTILTGLLYPVAVTLTTQTIFPHQSMGSLLQDDDQHIVGSLLIGQNFTQSRYLWGRLSATSEMAYNGMASGASNYSVTHQGFSDAVKKRMNDLTVADYENTDPIPVDLVTSSGSGLDPHLSVAGAYYQIARIAKERQIAPEDVKKIVDMYTQKPQWGFFGQTTVNILQVNLALDKYHPVPEDVVTQSGITPEGSQELPQATQETTKK
jgi:potassium-transporting ATPase KdpC subunit